MTAENEHIGPKGAEECRILHGIQKFDEKSEYNNETQTVLILCCYIKIVSGN